MDSVPRYVAFLIPMIQSKYFRESFGLCKCGAAAGLVDGLFGATNIPLPAEFALGRGRSSTLFARTRFGLGQFLPFAGETRLGHVHASATGALRTTLTAESFSFVCISFARPFVLGHGATRARRQRG
jgi:hypothetical protein